MSFGIVKHVAANNGAVNVMIQLTAANNEAAAKIKIPALFVVAEKEELTNNDVVLRVHEELTKRGVASTFQVIKGATHYGIYSDAFDEATRVEIEWLDAQLKK